MEEIEKKVCRNCNRSFSTVEDYLKNTKRWRQCEFNNLWFNCECNSTLMIKKGKFPWYSPDLGMNTETKSVFNQLSNLKELPHIPSHIMELQQLLNDPEIGVNELAAHAKKDPVICASLLQMAENIRRSRDPGNEPLKSVEHSIVYVGLKAFSDIVLTAALKAFKVPASDFDVNAFWEESFTTGTFAEAICDKLNLKLNKDEVYLAGCLANIGKLVAATCYPEKASEIQLATKTIKRPKSWYQAEKDLDFPQHTILGDIAAPMWGLPDFISDVTNNHHSPPNAGLTLKRWTIDDAVSFAIMLYHWINLEPHKINQSHLDEYIKSIGYDDSQMDELVEELMILKTKLSFNIAT